jgi:CheY-like chemotaxis protein
MATPGDFAAALNALSSVLWPIIAAVVLFALGRGLTPALQNMLESRTFTLKVGKFELSAQEASDKLQADIDDLRTKVSTLGSRLEEVAAPPALAASAEGETFDVETEDDAVQEPPTHFKRLLWVDDNPANNAFELASLERRGLVADLAQSSTEALAMYAPGRYDAVITDLGREEAGSFHPLAGLDLTHQLRAIDRDIPIFVYTGQASVERRRDELLQAGANAVTSSTTALLELIFETGATFSRHFERLVGSLLTRHADVEPETGFGADYVVTRGGTLAAVEIKAWRPPVSLPRINRAARALEAQRAARHADIGILVTPEPLTVAQAARDAFPQIRYMSLSELEGWVSDVD